MSAAAARRLHALLLAVLQVVAMVADGKAVAELVVKAKRTATAEVAAAAAAVEMGAAAKAADNGAAGAEAAMAARGPRQRRCRTA
jgi:hypothetical protein